MGLRFAPMSRTDLAWSFSGGYSRAWGPRTLSFTYMSSGGSAKGVQELWKGGSLTAGISWSL
jgi:hypothetical protein